MTGVPAFPAVIGAFIGAVFGRVWLSWAGDGLPQRFQPVLDIAGWVVVAALAVWGLMLLRARVTVPPPSGPVRPWGWPIVVGVEVALIIVGHRMINNWGHLEWGPVWSLLVVGVHFFPFAWLFRLRAFVWLGAAMTALAVVTIGIAGGLGADRAWYLLPGFGGAAILWGAAVWAFAWLRTRARARETASATG